MDTVEDISLKKKYADELLKYIHSEIGLTLISRKKILKLIKEHKKMTQSLYKKTCTKQFEASFNSINEPLKGLKKLVDIFFADYKDNTIRDMFCLIAIRELKLDSYDVCLFLNIDRNQHNMNIKRIKEKIRLNKKLTKDYLEFMFININK